MTGPGWAWLRVWPERPVNIILLTGDGVGRMMMTSRSGRTRAGKDTMTATTTSTRHLIIVEDDGHQIDAGPATAAQLEASDDAADRGQDGLIRIDADGDPVAPGAWYQGQLRTAYVEL